MKTKIKAWQFTLICLGLLASHHIKAGFNYGDYKNWINQKGYHYCHRSEDYPKILTSAEAYSLRVSSTYWLQGSIFMTSKEVNLRLGIKDGNNYATLISLLDEYYVVPPMLSSSGDVYKVRKNNNFASEGVPSYEFFQTVLPDKITYLAAFTHNVGTNISDTYYNGYNWLRDVHQVEAIYFINNHRQNMSQSYARGCKNLKIISFTNIYHYSQDILLDCPNLETVRFTAELHPNATSLLHIFNTHYDRTGAYYYPKLTTFVVPDAHYDAYVEEINKATSLVRDGHAYVIPESLYKCPRITGGVSLSSGKVKLGKK